MTLPSDELHDEAPTETIPVVRDGLDDFDDDLFDDGGTRPKRRSAMTVALFIAVLVAIGFLAGVVVGRNGSASDTPQRGAGTAVSSSARPPGSTGALGRIGG
ncbi:MAG TPA: hypothetical protein VGE11_16815 [Pseudonocardia sp.]